ncbi:unnamed protein product [Rhizophagus irregularis]|nr:unnamed protein product [Rhizophagus irregularis]
MIIQTITGTLFVTGDIIAQQFVEQRGLKSHNFYRTLRLGEFESIHRSTAIWYRSLDRFVTIKNPMLGLLTRVTLDPMFYYNIFRRSGTIRRSTNFRKAWRCKRCKYKFLSEYLS